MGENKSNREGYADPTAAEAIGNVERQRRKQKGETSTGCFASRKGKCSVLNVSKCEGLKCGFYKTEAQITEERGKTFKRIKSLEKEEQLEISEKYYGNKMPWLKGDN